MSGLVLFVSRGKTLDSSMGFWLGPRATLLCTYFMDII
jgi:hypothetical protein